MKLRVRKWKWVLFGIMFVVGIVLMTYSLWSPYFLPQDTRRAEDIPGYIGRLTIDSVGIDVGCIEVTESNGYTNDDLKYIMDNDNCAVRFWKNADIIADHNTEGFSTLHECQIGDQVILSLSDGTEEIYEVVKSPFIAINTTRDILVDGRSILRDNPGGIILYTCVDWTTIPVYVVYLQPIA